MSVREHTDARARNLRVRQIQKKKKTPLSEPKKNGTLQPKSRITAQRYTVQLLRQHPLSTNICWVINNLPQFDRISSNLKPYH